MREKLILVLFGKEMSSKNSTYSSKDFVEKQNLLCKTNLKFFFIYHSLLGESVCSLRILDI
jgi:hypothetical protein